jgi:hypothetical protein
MEDRIKESLIALMDAIRRSEGPAMAREITQIEALLAQGRGSLHPQLVHFLERRSYPKALLFLGGSSDIPAGACGGRR